MTNLAKPNLKLTDSVERLAGVGPEIVKKLHRLKIFTVRDLLEFIPRRVEDRSQLVPIRQLMVGKPSVIQGEIKSVHSRRSQKGALIIDAKVADLSGQISCLWFNQRWLLGQLKVGQTAMLYGEKRLAPSLGNPFFVNKIINKLELAPIYPITSGLSQTRIASLVLTAKKLINQLDDIVPEPIRHQQGLPTRATAISDCHFSIDQSKLIAAKNLLAFEELLILSTQILQAKADRLKFKGQAFEIDPAWLRTVAATLPFHLTNGQRRVAWQIIQDLAKPVPMYRLLYGEVGSGKTLVALMAAAAMAKAGRQVVWLNPTAVLVAQQAETIRRIATPLGLTVAVVTSAYKDDYLKADIIIGTHAILETKINLPELGLIIVDEQHRFGVDQRQLLLTRHPQAHLLMMTATPIPRSLTQTLFGYLDVSFLLDKPPGQQSITTKIITAQNREALEAEIDAKLKNNEPGFVICPLIDPSETSELSLFLTERKTITGETKRLSQRYPGARIGVVHGRIPIKTREQLLADFKTGKIDILLSTTVVEVGIDNPKATWILIEEADRFGLATLHQLRGRVGRGTKEATCYLAESVETDLARQRLGVLTTTTNGIAIAEADLRFRGPGEVIGLEQSGLLALKYATLGDTSLIEVAFKSARSILETGLDKFPILVAEVLKQNYGQTYQRS